MASRALMRRLLAGLWLALGLLLCTAGPALAASDDDEPGLVHYLIDGLALGLLVVAGWVYARRRKRHERRVVRAAAVAADDDPDFDPDRVRTRAEELFTAVHEARNRGDREELARLLAPGLLAEWSRQLDELARTGRRRHVEVQAMDPVEYLGLVNRAADADDRVTVRISVTVLDEVWRTDEPAAGYEGVVGDVLSMIESYASTTGFVRRQDEPAEVADLDYAGAARTAALDLSLVDGRWAPDVLEASVRRAVAAWAVAVDGADRDLLDVATPRAAVALLHPGDPSGRTRRVIRGAHVRHLSIAALDPAVSPPTMTVEVARSPARPAT